MSKSESEEIVVASLALSPGGNPTIATATKTEGSEGGEIKEATTPEPEVISEEILKWREYMKSTERSEGK